MQGNKMTLAERLHDSYIVRSQIEDQIMEAFEKYEPEIYNDLDFEIGSDDYDNSIEIYIQNSIPYPYEPCKEIREIIYSMGFSIVYWNFKADKVMVECDRIIGSPNKLMESYDEIRGWEPRHGRYHRWIPTKYGYVDERFNEKEWTSKYHFKISTDCKIPSK